MEATNPTEPTGSPAARRRLGGRPRKGPDALRAQWVRYRVTPAELADLEARASQAGMSVSALVREAMHGAQQPAGRYRAAVDTAPILAQLAWLGNNMNQLARHANMGDFSPELEAEAIAAMRAAAAYLRQLAGAADDPES